MLLKSIFIWIYPLFFLLIAKGMASFCFLSASAFNNSLEQHNYYCNKFLFAQIIAIGAALCYIEA